MGQMATTVLVKECLSWQSPLAKIDRPVGAKANKVGRSTMRIMSGITGFAVILAVTAPTMAGTMRSKVSFNTGIQKPAAEQPADGMAVTWEVKLSGGELDGCTASLLDHLFPRDNGSWGIFELVGTVTCDKGAFKFTTTGAWDKNAFHGAGTISKDGRSGEFAQAEGRVAQIGASFVPAAKAGTFDASYDLVIDRTDK